MSNSIPSNTSSQRAFSKPASPYLRPADGATGPKPGGGLETGAAGGDELPDDEVLDLPTQGRDERNAGHGIQPGQSHEATPGGGSERSKPTNPHALPTDAAEGDKVGFDYFTSREGRLIDLIDAGDWMSQYTGGKGGIEPGRASFDELSKGVGTPNNGDGKNNVSRRGQLADGESSGGDAPASNSVRTEPTFYDTVNNQSINPPGMDKSQTQDEAALDKGIPAAPASKDAPREPADRPSWTPIRDFWNWFARTQDESRREAAKKDPGHYVSAPVGVRGQPNPEADTGDPARLPRLIGGSWSPDTKSRSELEAERKRQVTQPGEDTRTLPRVQVDPAERWGGTLARLTDGSIRPADDGAPATGGGGAKPSGKGAGNPRPVDPLEGFGVDNPTTGTGDPDGNGDPDD